MAQIPPPMIKMCGFYPLLTSQHLRVLTSTSVREPQTFVLALWSPSTGVVYFHVWGFWISVQFICLWVNTGRKGGGESGQVRKIEENSVKKETLVLVLETASILIPAKMRRQWLARLSGILWSFRVHNCIKAAYMFLQYSSAQMEGGQDS